MDVQTSLETDHAPSVYITEIVSLPPMAQSKLSILTHRLPGPYALVDEYFDKIWEFPVSFVRERTITRGESFLGDVRLDFEHNKADRSLCRVCGKHILKQKFATEHYQKSPECWKTILRVLRVPDANGKNAQMNGDGQMSVRPTIHHVNHHAHLHHMVPSGGMAGNHFMFHSPHLQMHRVQHQQPAMITGHPHHFMTPGSGHIQAGQPPNQPNSSNTHLNMNCAASSSSASNTASTPNANFRAMDGLYEKARAWVTGELIRQATSPAPEVFPGDLDEYLQEATAEGKAALRLESVIPSIAPSAPQEKPYTFLRILFNRAGGEWLKDAFEKEIQFVVGFGSEIFVRGRRFTLVEAITDMQMANQAIASGLPLPNEIKNVITAGWQELRDIPQRNKASQSTNSPSSSCTTDSMISSINANISLATKQLLNPHLDNMIKHGFAFIRCAVPIMPEALFPVFLQPPSFSTAAPPTKSVSKAGSNYISGDTIRPAFHPDFCFLNGLSGALKVKMDMADRHRLASIIKTNIDHYPADSTSMVGELKHCDNKNTSCIAKPEGELTESLENSQHDSPPIYNSQPQVIHPNELFRHNVVLKADSQQQKYSTTSVQVVDTNNKLDQSTTIESTTQIDNISCSTSANYHNTEEIINNLEDKVENQGTILNLNLNSQMEPTSEMSHPLRVLSTPLGLKEEIVDFVSLPAIHSDANNLNNSLNTGPDTNLISSSSTACLNSSKTNHQHYFGDVVNRVDQSNASLSKPSLSISFPSTNSSMQNDNNSRNIQNVVSGTVKDDNNSNYNAHFDSSSIKNKIQNNILDSSHNDNIISVDQLNYDKALPLSSSSVAGPYTTTASTSASVGDYAAILLKREVDSIYNSNSQTIQNSAECCSMSPPNIDNDRKEFALNEMSRVQLEEYLYHELQRPHGIFVVGPAFIFNYGFPSVPASSSSHILLNSSPSPSSAIAGDQTVDIHTPLSYNNQQSSQISLNSINNNNNSNFLNNTASNNLNMHTPNGIVFNPKNLQSSQVASRLRAPLAANYPFATPSSNCSSGSAVQSPVVACRSHSVVDGGNKSSSSQLNNIKTENISSQRSDSRTVFQYSSSSESGNSSLTAKNHLNRKYDNCAPKIMNSGGSVLRSDISFQSSSDGVAVVTNHRNIVDSHLMLASAAAESADDDHSPSTLSMRISNSSNNNNIISTSIPKQHVDKDLFNHHFGLNDLCDPFSSNNQQNLSSQQRNDNDINNKPFISAIGRRRTLLEYESQTDAQNVSVDVDNTLNHHHIGLSMTSSLGGTISIHHHLHHPIASAGVDSPLDMNQRHILLPHGFDSTVSHHHALLGSNGGQLPTGVGGEEALVDLSSLVSRGDFTATAANGGASAHQNLMAWLGDTPQNGGVSSVSHLEGFLMNSGDISVRNVQNHHANNNSNSINGMYRFQGGNSSPSLILSSQNGSRSPKFPRIL